MFNGVIKGFEYTFSHNRPLIVVLIELYFFYKIESLFYL